MKKRLSKPIASEERFGLDEQLSWPISGAKANHLRFKHKDGEERKNKQMKEV